MLHLVPTEGTARHVVSLDPHLEFSWHPWQLPAVKGSGTHCQLHPGRGGVGRIKVPDQLIKAEMM